MPSIAFAAMAVLPALALLWWALLRRTTTVIPHALTETVESEDFRKWLGEDSSWILWGRDEEGRYYAVTPGALAGRRIRRKTREFRKPGEREASQDADAGQRPA